ncbi:hypothetical protein MMC28_009799 [Mycoblastus sanguinarius]|nr:hypothetical protein [Mycoblastus sanguinarius]
MPGRQSTIAPSPKKSKSQRQKAKRSLNALAIAEKQTPTRIKIRKTRLGQSEPEPAKRKRRDEGEDPEFENVLERSKRRKAGDKDQHGNEIEGGSDSSGNEWMTGQVNSDEDSDLDSDEAMGESDEERFDGFTFRGSSATRDKDKPRRKDSEDVPEDGNLGGIDLREEVNQGTMSDEDDDDLGDEAVDLATMLDASDDTDDGGDRDDTTRKTGRTGHPGGGDSGSESENQSADAASWDDEEESILSFSDDEQDVEDSAKLASLQALVSNMNEQSHDLTRIRAPADAQESTTPSEFGLNSKRKLTVADMIPSVTDPRLRKSLKLLDDNVPKGSSKRRGIPKKLDAPLPKRQQDRLDRAAAYDKSKETLSRWIDTVKHNRRAEHLSFPLKDPDAVIAQGTQRLLPTTSSKPLTDLESTIQNILQYSGLAGPNDKSEEDQLQAFEELKTNKMPLEEVKARRAELRRARELLFREEIRAKRIKKIKSKTYRKVHRKERERMAQYEKNALTAAGVDDSESEQERNDRRRAEERMGARHRESKWAKGVKDSGRARWDEDARGGVTEMARRGEELKQRIKGKHVDVEEDSLTSSGSDGVDDDDDGNFEGGDERKAAKLQARLQRLDDNSYELESKANDSGLASMDFMKKAEAARKTRNDEAVESLRRDLAGEETPSEEEATEGPGRKLFGPTKSKLPPPKYPSLEQKSEFEERKGSDVEDDEDHRDPEEEDTEIVVDSSSLHDKSGLVKEPLLGDRKRKEARQTNGDARAEASENPWLTSTKKGSNVGKKRTQNPHAGAIISNSLTSDQIPNPAEKPKPRSALKGSRDAEKARQSVQPPSAAAAPTEDTDSEDEDANTDNLPFVLRNQDLVRKAFAGDEVVASFEAEKRDAIQDEGEKIIDNTLPGWGNWAGEGIGKKAQKRNKNRFTTTEPGIAAEKRQDAKLARVIINEKRVKKNAKYLASSLPHPFETRQQYERSLRLPVGPEWTTKETFQAATKPRILMKQGIIAPMAKPTM